MNFNEENDPEKELIEIQEQEKKDQIYWTNYNTKLIDSIRDIDIYTEVKTFKQLNEKKKNSFFYKLSKALGF